MVLGIVAAGWHYFTGKTETAGSQPTPESKRKVLYWTDPMRPDYRSDKPGKSPFMDMELVPVYEGEPGTGGVPVVTIRPEVVNNLGVRTYQVVRGGIPHMLTAQGYLFRAGGNMLVLADIFDRDTTWVRPGISAEIRIPSLPERTWEGTVENVVSDVDIGARSYKVRVRILKADATLKPNMFADVTLKAVPRGEQKIVIPREAVIRTGSRTVVVLGLGEGRFQPVEIAPGEESGDWIEIRRGVKEGDKVVVSGQFLIDSEASVRASFQRMETKPAESHDGHGEQHP